MDFHIMAAFVIYFCILTCIGLFFYVKNKNATDFMIGNRSINYWVTAIATQSSDMSSWLFLAFPAAIYAQGLPQAWTAIGLVTGMFICWQFIAPKLRSVTAQYNDLTLSSYFASRYNDKYGTLRIITALFAIVFFTFYIASSLVGLGRLFASAFGISYHAGIVLGLVSALGYTLLGGFIAVAWCDLFQGLFLLAAIVIVPVYTLYTLGSAESILVAAQARALPLTLFPSLQDTFNSILLAASWGLGYFGQPHILTNFMAIDDVRNIKYAKYVGITWQIMVLTAAICVGLVGIAYFNTGIGNPEDLFIIMTKQQFFPLLAGFILCGILAATLSTMDRHILISGSIVAEDLYKKIMHKHASSVWIMQMSRIASVVISCIALFIARNNSSSIYELVNYSWSGLGSSFGPLVIMSLYSSSVTRHAAIAGVLVGGIVSGLWPYLNTGMLPLVPGFGLSLLTIIGVSWLQRKRA